MIKVLKNKSGMTLMELAAGLLLFTLIVLTATSVLVPMLRAYYAANELAESSTLLDNLANQIISDLSCATAIGESGSNVLEITVNHLRSVRYDAPGGILHKDGAVVFAEDFYKRKIVSFTALADDSGREYTLTVTLLSYSGDKIISRTYAVKPLALYADSF